MFKDNKKLIYSIIVVFVFAIISLIVVLFNQDNSKVDYDVLYEENEEALDESILDESLLDEQDNEDVQLDNEELEDTSDNVTSSGTVASPNTSGSNAILPNVQEEDLDVKDDLTILPQPEVEEDVLLPEPEVEEEFIPLPQPEVEEDLIPEVEEENVESEPAFIYLTNIQSQIKNVYDPSGVVKYNYDHQGDLISLYENEEEVVYEQGIAMSGGNVCITFTDLKMYGYEYFSAYFGSHYIARAVNSIDTSFTFEVLLDDVSMYLSNPFTAFSNQEYFELDLEGGDVLQIIVHTGDTVLGDYAAIGDPYFYKSSLSPYVDVFDIEFNSPHQVTKSNLLYYAEAWDQDLTDISSDLSYETDYIEGEIGEFSVTYYVTGSNGCTASRTVKLTVTGQDYTEPWTIEDYKTPYVNYLYHTRNTLTAQGRKLFDIVLSSVLDFNPEGGEYYSVVDYTAYSETVYQVNFDLEKAGIFMNVSEYNNSFHNVCTDTDPRAYFFKQWSSGNRYSVNSSTGLLKTQVVFISKSWFSQYETMIPSIIENTETFLAYAKDDMTDAQKLYYVTTPYKDWMRYSDGGFLVHSLGQGYGKCGGNAMGVVHLAQRLGITSLYGQVYTSSGELHAASYQKLVDEDGWYMCDKLWAKQWTAPLLSGFSLNARSGYGWIEYASETMESYKFTSYPSIWMDLKDTTIFLEQGDSFDLEGNIEDINSVLDEQLTNDIVSITIKNENDIVVGNHISSLPIGVYTVYYDIYYEGIITVERSYEAKLIIYTNETMFDSSMVIDSSGVTGYGTRTLWNTTTSLEESFDNGCTINNGGYITIDNSQGYNVISLKYGASSGVRLSDYAISNCRVALYVYYDGELHTNTATLTAYSNYVSLKLYIPDGVSTIELNSRAVSNASAHASIADIRLYSVNQIIKYNDVLFKEERDI